MEKTVVSAIAEIILVEMHGGTESYYQILLNDRPVILSNVRVYKTPGAARVAMKRTIFTVLWNFQYWSTYSDNIAKRNDYSPAGLKEAFATIQPVHERITRGLTTSLELNRSIKKEADSLYNTMLESGMVRIEKIQ